MGIEYYVTDSDGTGGRLRDEPADFRVRELERFDAEPVDADPGAYPHVLLRVTLEDWDTNDFAGALSDRLGISRERVSWAGTKDKRAVTTQLFSVKDIEPESLPDLGDVGYEVVGRTGRPILFGDLDGNEFQVTVRDPERPEAAGEITSRLREFAGDESDEIAVGVPNFFGQQRFGSYRPVTHEVGLAILRGNWEDAVLTYVGNPSEREPDRTREAREFVDQTRDWQAALERFPGHLGYERSMLHRLVEADDEPSDFRAALEALPTNLQQLFIHAAQSSVFNRILSERLRRGLPFHRPIEGDIVCFADTDASGDLVIPDPERTQRVTSERLDTVSRHCERGRAFVTAPLVGTETEFADGELGEITADVLETLDLSPADFALPDEFGSEGTRRAILVRTSLDLSTDPLQLSFSLPKGSYATVLLREYLKTDPNDL